MPACPLIYKICTAAEWREAERDGVVSRLGGRPPRRLHPFLDRRAGRRDGSHMVRRPARSGAGQRSMPTRSATSLKWEPSRGGALFPHLYGELPLAAVRRVDPLPLDDSGRHVFRKTRRNSGQVGRSGAAINHPLTIHPANIAGGELTISSECSPPAPSPIAGPARATVALRGIDFATAATASDAAHDRRNRCRPPPRP